MGKTLHVIFSRKKYAIFIGRLFGNINKYCTFALPFFKEHAQVAELVDALVSNTCGITPVPVRLRSWAHGRKP